MIIEKSNKSIHIPRDRARFTKTEKESIIQRQRIDDKPRNYCFRRRRKWREDLPPWLEEAKAEASVIDYGLEMN